MYIYVFINLDVHLVMKESQLKTISLLNYFKFLCQIYDICVYRKILYCICEKKSFENNIFTKIK